MPLLLAWLALTGWRLLNADESLILVSKTSSLSHQLGLSLERSFCRPDCCFCGAVSPFFFWPALGLDGLANGIPCFTSLLAGWGLVFGSVGFQVDKGPGSWLSTLLRNSSSSSAAADLRASLLVPGAPAEGCFSAAGLSPAADGGLLLPLLSRGCAGFAAAASSNTSTRTPLRKSSKGKPCGALTAALLWSGVVPAAGVLGRACLVSAAG